MKQRKPTTSHALELLPNREGMRHVWQQVSFQSITAVSHDEQIRIYRVHLHSWLEIIRILFSWSAGEYS